MLTDCAPPVFGDKKPAKTQGAPAWRRPGKQGKPRAELAAASSQASMNRGVDVKFAEMNLVESCSG